MAKNDESQTSLTPEDARVILTRLVEHLREQYYPLPVNGQKTPIGWATTAANAIDKYLSGRVKSLDNAFGLNRRDTTSKFNEHVDIAREILDLRLAGNSWKDVADIFEQKDYSVKDERSLRRIYQKFFSTVAADKIELDEILPDNEGGA